MEQEHGRMQKFLDYSGGVLVALETAVGDIARMMGRTALGMQLGGTVGVLFGGLGAIQDAAIGGFVG